MTLEELAKMEKLIRDTVEIILKTEFKNNRNFAKDNFKKMMELRTDMTKLDGDINTLRSNLNIYREDSIQFQSDVKETIGGFRNEVHSLREWADGRRKENNVSKRKWALIFFVVSCFGASMSQLIAFILDKLF